jgi:hypothetical protein
MSLKINNRLLSEKDDSSGPLDAKKNTDGCWYIILWVLLGVDLVVVIMKLSII